jgi:hypothetical protein
VSDWAPYRYGRWEYVSPWGWTWVDDAPWGFAPFHYGRWAQIGPRWAWVPGRIGPRPVYAPALVAFVGGNGGVDFSLSFGSSPGIGWFPLGPGEAWRPFYRTSSVYIDNVNRYEGFRGRWPDRYVNQHRPGAWTSVRVEDFSRGRPVNNNWRPMRPADLGRAQIQQAVPALPQPRRFAETAQPMRGGTLRPPQLSAQGNPAPNFGGRPQGLFRGENQNAQREVRPNAQGANPPNAPRANRENASRASRENAPGALRPPVVEQRAHPPQVREQAQEERGRRMQMQEQRSDQQRVQREQQVQAQREHAQRQQQQAQERAVRQQQQAQERMVRQQEQAQRQQLQQQQREHEMGARRLAPPPQVQQHQEAPRQEPQRGGGGGEGRGRGQGGGNDEEGRRHGGRGG